MRLTDVFDKLTTLYYRPFSELKQQEDISSYDTPQKLDH